MSPSPEPSATSIWTALNAWGRTLKPWQRALLHRAVQHTSISDADIAAGYESYLVANGLAAAASAPLAAAPPFVARSSSSTSVPLVLDRVDNMQGVNAIPDGTALSFAAGLTVIYGRNGAGKTGFARVIANSCFSRHKPNILSDVRLAAKKQPSAQFHFRLGNEACPPFQYGDGSRSDTLERVSFFDRIVADQHVGSENTFEYKPAGFDVFPELARAYTELAKKLDSDIASRRLPNDFPQSFLEPTTSISTTIVGLSKDTDLIALAELANFGENELARLSTLDEQLVSLRSSDTTAAVSELQQARDGLADLLLKLRALGEKFGTEEVERRDSLAAAAKAREADAALAGTEQFRRPFFSAVGSVQWEQFVHAAHGLAAAESPEYPAINSPCLLCERPLDDAAHSHVTALLAYVHSDAQQKAQQAQAAALEATTELNNLDLNVFSETSRLYDQISKLEPATATLISAELAHIQQCKSEAISALAERRPAIQQPRPSGDAYNAISTLIERLEANIVTLTSGDRSAAIAILEAERQMLRHRQVLSRLYAQIEKWVTVEKWCATAEASRRTLSTRHITEKQKELFNKIINEGYRARLSDECEALDCELPIEMQTTPRAGETKRSFTIAGSRHRLSEVLSEGEQRAIALADFLTEVGLNPASAGIVLDDPVTSQDHERKARIAARLVKEASDRQVIVFTHDLVFANQLFKAADDADMQYDAHRIERNADGQPGEVSLRDPVGTSKFYDTTERAKQFLAAAKATKGSARDDNIRKGMGALRRTVEETVAKRVFKGVVPRWEDRVIVTGLARVKWDQGLVDELCRVFEELSRHIEGHTHTDEAMGAPPDIQLLETYIGQMDDLVRRARADR